MRRPLPAVALLYLGGILVGHLVPLPPGGLLALSFGLLFLAWWRSAARTFYLGLLLVFAGWSNLARHVAVLSPHDLRTLVGERAALVTVVGRLEQTPTQRVRERAGKVVWRSLAAVEVTALRERARWEPAFGRVMVSTPGVLGTNLFAGQTVVVTGVLRPPPGPAAEGLFDYRAYLAAQEIYDELRTEGPQDWRVAIGRSRPWADRFQAWARRTLARGLPAEDEPLGLLWAMTLGWHTALTGEVAEPFMRTGTMHIFAISGLHIALIAGMLVSVLRVLRMPRGFCGLVVIPLIWFYAGATGWQASAIRSTIMMSVIIAGWALRRPSDLLNSLAAAGLILLLWQPQQVFQASFQLSFFVVLSIALLLPAFDRVRQRLLRGDPLLPPELRPRWRRWLEPAVRAVTTSLATSLAACIGALPLVAYYFHLVTPVSLLANLAIVPLGSLALMSNLASLFCGDWLPALTVLFNHSAWFWMGCMARLSAWAAGLPGAYFYVRAPALSTFIVYYAMVFALFTGWAWRKGGRRWVVLVLGALLVFEAVRWQVARGAERLTVLALGGGEAVFYDAPGSQPDLLVNCGNASGAEFLVTPFLRAQGVNRLDQFLLTHGLSRVMGGAATVAHEFHPRTVVTGPGRFRSVVYRRLLRDLRKRRQRWQQVSRGNRVGPWRVLHPAAASRFSRAEDQALVLRGTFQGTRVLLVSSLGRGGQESLGAASDDLSADVVVAGLPGDGEPLDDALLDVVRPRLIVLNSGAQGSAGVSDRLRRRLARRDVPVLCTGESGSITVTFGPGGCCVRAMDGRRLSLLSSPCKK